MTRVMIGWVMIVDTSGCLLRASSPLTVTHSSVDALTRPSRGNVGERERAMRSSHLLLVDDRDSHVGAPQALVDEAARTAAGGLLCCLVDGKPRFRVQIAIAREGVLAVALELGEHMIPVIATPGMSISGGGDIVRVDVRTVALKLVVPNVVVRGLDRIIQAGRIQQRIRLARPLTSSRSMQVRQGRARGPARPQPRVRLTHLSVPISDRGCPCTAA